MYNKIFLLKSHFLDVSLTSDTNNTSNSISNIPNSNKSEDDICASSNKDSNNILICNKSDKIDHSLPLFDKTHSNDNNKNPAFFSKNIPTLSSDGNPNNDNNMINGKSLICMIYLYI